jgi:hypothetical protein
MAASEETELERRLRRQRAWEVGAADSNSEGDQVTFSASSEGVVRGSPPNKEFTTKRTDATTSKDVDLAAKLAARRQWEGGGDRASAAEPAPAKATPAKSTPSPPAKSAQAASAPGAVPPSDDLAAKLASRRQWEGGNGSAPAPAPALAVKAPAVSGAPLPKSAPGCVPPADCDEVGGCYITNTCK